MPIADFLQDYIWRRVSIGDSLFKSNNDAWMRDFWLEYQRIRYDVRVRMQAAGEEGKAVLSRTGQVIWPDTTELPGGGLLFVDSCFKEIMRAAGEHGPVTHLSYFSPETPPEATEGVTNVSLMKWAHDIYALRGAPSSLQGYQLQLIVEEIASFLSRLSPRAVVLRYDSLPTERTIILAARALGIPVVTIQHGFVSSAGPVEWAYGNASDYLLVWGEQTKEFLVSNGILPDERIIVLGYPYVPSPGNSGQHSSSVERPPICFVGQNFEFYNAEQGEEKRQVVARFKEACTSLGIPYVYRPHPGEQLAPTADIIPAENIVGRGQYSNKVMPDYSALVSISSTMLLENALVGGISLEIYEPLFKFDDLQQIGACYSCANSREAIEDSLSRIWAGELTSFPVNPQCISVSDNVGEEFLRIIDAITGSWHRHFEEHEPSSRSLLCMIGPEKEISAGILQKARLANAVPHCELSPSGSTVFECSEPYGLSGEVIAALGDFRAKGLTTPTDLDLKEICAHLSMAPHDLDASSLVLCSRLGAFTLPYWRQSYRDVRAVIVIPNPRKMLERHGTDADYSATACALQWLETLSAVLANSLGIPTTFVFPDEPSAGSMDETFESPVGPSEDAVPEIAMSLYGCCLASAHPPGADLELTGSISSSVQHSLSSVGRNCYHTALRCLTLSSSHNLEAHGLTAEIIERRQSEQLQRQLQQQLEQDIEGVQVELDNARRTVSDISSELTRVSAQLEEALAEATTFNHELNSVRNSRSWRLLGFARRLSTLGRSVLGRQRPA